MKKVSFEEITDTSRDKSTLPWLDRIEDPYSLKVPLDAHQEQWVKEGVVTLKGIIPENLIEKYVSARQRHLGGGPMERTGWYLSGFTDPTPYLRVPEMRDIALHPPLMDVMKSILGEDMGLHLCLTGYQSTERRWHQDDYLNPPYVNSRYAAVWMALDDIHPDSGPFQYVPGSHRWPLIRREKVWSFMYPEDARSPGWPTLSQGFVADACEAEIAARQAPILSYLPKRGDVLIWHGCLIHQGSKPKNPEAERRSLICHYSTLRSRTDMPHRIRREDGTWYFDFPDHRH